ncbi:MAG: hypothetical protein IPL04_07885 [Chitinophagaceae bacterium]|nr:hypothetical protein [Chitinophagaceae bacterium]
MSRYSPIVLNNLKEEFIQPLQHATRPDKATPNKGEILYRVGVDEIIFNYNNAHDIQKKYGMAYDFYDVNGYAFEMKYFELGISFFFHQADFERKIFSGRIWKEFDAFQKISERISSGIRPFLILHDVFVSEMREEEIMKSYDETYFVNYGFFRYHFIPDENSSEELFPIESIALVGDGF